MIKELLESGNDPNASYKVEHYFLAEDFKLLENW
ncbi:MAG: ribonuclease E inhibitor RraB [Arsenophonus sp. NC-TX2-MAG3]